MRTLDMWIWAILFVAFFPVLWLFAWWLDRVWPTTTDRLLRRGAPLKRGVPD